MDKEVDISGGNSLSPWSLGGGDTPGLNYSLESNRFFSSGSGGVEGSSGSLSGVNNSGDGIFPSGDSVSVGEFFLVFLLDS